jgi:NADPH:quinone reductase-like Zn-dependent oxidoreductase
MRVWKWISLSVVVLLVGGFTALYFHDPAPPLIRNSGETMQAVVYHEYGAAEVLKLEQTVKPLPNDNQLLVQVKAASVNPLDWHYMRGTPYLMRFMGTGPRKPADARMGADVAGVVVAVGKDVTKFKVGDEVFGVSPGAFAEYAPISERRAALKPINLTFEQAAAVPVAAVTALQALRDSGHVQKGQKVLINGASGGVGTFAVQIAKAFGAEVTGVCSTRNVEMVRRIGADFVVDYTKRDVTESAEKYDLIIDNVGTQPMRSFRRVMKPNATYVLIGGGGPEAGQVFGPLAGPVKALFYSPFVSQEFVVMYADTSHDNLITLKQLIEDQKVTPVIDRTYPLSETATAIRYLEQGHARGKVVIAVTPPN